MALPLVSRSLALLMLCSVPRLGNSGPEGTFCGLVFFPAKIGEQSELSEDSATPRLAQRAHAGTIDIRARRHCVTCDFAKLLTVWFFAPDRPNRPETSKSQRLKAIPVAT